MQSQINTRLFKLKAGPRRLDPTAVNCCASPGSCVHTVVWRDLFQVLSTLLLLPFLGSSEGSSEGELGKQSLRHCRLGNLRREHVLNSQESQVQTVTFWWWLCDPWETWQHLKKMGIQTSSLFVWVVQNKLQFGKYFKWWCVIEYKAVLVWRNFIYQYTWKITAIIFI